MVLAVQPLKKTDNVSWLNAFRNLSSPDYQRRVPVATQANLTDTVAAITEYGPNRNEFIDALVNQIGLVIAKNNSWTNPLAKFKRGMLTKGNTIEEIQSGLLKAHTYDSDRDYLEKDLFGRETPDVQTSFHKVNRKDWYKLTIDEAALERAFLEPEGLNQFISQLMEAATTSDNWDEFLLTTRLLREFYDNGGFFKVQIPDVGAESSTPADARFAIRRIKEYVSKLQFLSEKYNPAHMPITAQVEEIELLVTPEFIAAIEVEALAAAFNVGLVNLPYKLTVIPAENMDIPGAQCIVTTKYFFVIADHRFETNAIANPLGLYQNFFLHRHQIISVSRFAPAILFTTEAGTEQFELETPVQSVEAMVFRDSDGVIVTEFVRGQLYTVTTDAVTLPAGGFNNAVILALAGNESDLSKITQTGVIHVGYDEGATEFLVGALSLYDNSKSVTSTVPLVGPQLDAWPNGHVNEDTDLDGLFEVEPDELTKVGTKVKIPVVEGVVYKNGATVVEKEITISGATTIVASALAGYEIKTGSTVSWTFNV